MRVFRPHVLLFPLVLLLCVAVLGCGSDDEKRSAGRGAGSTDSRAVIAKVTPSTVSINGSEGDYHSHGTGVVVDTDPALVVTNGHVVDQARTISVVVGEKKAAKGRVVARAQCQDLALIALYPEQEGLVALPYADSGSVRAGDPVSTFGYPGLPAASGKGYERAAVTEGRVSVAGVSAALTPLLPSFPELIAHQAPVAKNSSGGPLIDAKGGFVGLNVAITGPQAAEDGPPGLFYAIPSNYLKKLMDELQPGERSFYRGWEKYHRCHGNMAKLARSVQVADHDLPAGARPSRGGDAGAGHHGG